MSTPSIPSLLKTEWQELVEKNDRTSPEEYPDMALITCDELAEIISRARAGGMDNAAKIAISMITWVSCEIVQGHQTEMPATLADQAYWDVAAAIRAAKERT
jgi:hypothetical protein